MTDLPQAFAPFADEILSSARPSVRFTLVADPTTPFDSKVGGTPYLPQDFDYPTDTQGEPMAFLAQINFEQMPALPHFPRTGILQFFIKNNDECFGINYEDFTDRSGYRLIYHAQVDKDSPQGEHDVEIGEYTLPFPADHSYRIAFDDATPQAITTHDFGFDETVPNLAKFLNDQADQKSYDWKLHSEYDHWTQAESHRVGGYPYFTQDDVRGWEHSEPLSEYVLLFQLVSEYGDNDESVDVMWGDCGVGNFFIHPEDLTQLRFERAFFTMDCC